MLNETITLRIAAMDLAIKYKRYSYDEGIEIFELSAMFEDYLQEKDTYKDKMAAILDKINLANEKEKSSAKEKRTGL